MSAFALLTQFLVWFRLGIQSFGGGMATLTLIRRAVVDELLWVSPDDFARYWALAMMVPGINLLGLTVLIGKQVGGWRGVAAALSGVIPATVGVGLLTGLQIASPILKKSFQRGAYSTIIALALFFGSAVAEAIVHWPVVAILLTSGGIGAMSRRCWRSACSATIDGSSATQWRRA